jgi:DNA invertase Pin-like site-specific DNA recombinase
MNRSHWVSEKITPTHIAKLAYIYIRQSTMGQVTKHRESTELQYRLSQRAESLGWPADAIKIIDDDLGRSGSSSVERPGFQQLITEIGLGRVGMVLSYDASRLARNNKDWYQLLELCSLFDALIGDSERVYDPSLYHDRLLLGLSGIMSEAELHHLRRRLLAGKRLKAERGELRQRLPVGLVRLPSGEVIQHPHEDVRSRLMMVFDKFEELRSANAVARYFKKAKLLIPVRPAYDHDSTAHVWREPDRQRVLYMLHNPAYAGAYAYGRKTPDPTADKGSQWQVLIHDHYPGYITWATFLANQEQLKANLANFLACCSGVARQGASLLQGIIICHHCGLHMRIEYKGIRREPIYICSRPRIEADVASCQMVWGKLLDAEVEKLVLSALEPDQITIALAAHEKQEQETTTLARQWELRIERIRYETDRVRRQYDQVEPENRLVARSLERAWEDKLHQLEKVEREFAAWQHQQMTSKQSFDKRELMALAENFPSLWRSTTTTNKDKKEIIRLLVSHVIVEQDREQGKVWFQINWQTGAISQHWFIRIVGNYDSHAYKDALQKRMHELAGDHLTAPEIAHVLNDEGFQTAKRKQFTPEIVNQLRYKWGIPSFYRHARSPDRWPDGSYSVNGTAKILGISAGCLRKRIEKGHVKVTQSRKGASLHIFLTPEEIAQHKK